MFSALKRLAKRQDDASKSTPFPSGVAAVEQSMQKKFSKGVHYNMKIVIKGDRNTGKTCLFQRLQGKPFNEAYIPTQSIQAASINWNYRGHGSIVKVDVWDIVDKGPKKEKQESLKITNDDQNKNAESDMSADADFIDIYKGTHGVIMLLDITKPWTLQYVERELPKVPNHIPVLVMANRKDMCEHQLVEVDRITAFIEHLNRPVGSAEVNFAESSMKDGFGLLYLYRFLNIPFLILQRESLLQQLEANALEIEDTREALHLNKETEEQNYEMFTEAIRSRKSRSSGASSPSSETTETASQSSPSISTKNKEDVNSSSTEISSLPPTNIRQSAVSSVNVVAPGRDYSANVQRNISSDLESSKVQTMSKNPRDIHEFSPEDDLDPSFLSEEKQKRWWKRQANKKQSEQEVLSTSTDESDEEEGNPLVAAYQDFDSEDEQPAAVLYKSDTIETGSHVDNVEESSEEETETSSNKNPLVLDDVESLDNQHIKETNNRTMLDLEHKLSIGTQEDSKKHSTEELNEVNDKSDDVKKDDDHDGLDDDDDDDDDERDDSKHQYEVTADFDLDEPDLDNWLENSQDNTPTAKDQIQEKEDVHEIERDTASHSSFTIAADELDIFVTEQLRKESITKVSEEEEEVKKPKKKKEKKPGEEGTKKKKKKAAQESNKTGEPERERKIKKTKNKDGKKKKTQKQANEDYELI